MHDAKPATPVADTQQLSWDDLRILLAILRHEGIRGAAGQLGLDPSTVSRRLAALERALGTRLFERHPSGLRPTSAGEEAALVGGQLEEEVRELQIRLNSLDTAASGLVRVTTAEVVAPTSARLWGDFLRQNPLITSELHIGDGYVSVERHEVDVAIRVAESPGEQLVGRRVGVAALGLFASRAYVSAHGDDLTSTHHSFVEWPRGVEKKPAYQWLEQRHPTRSRRVRANSAEAVLRCVRAGLGVGLLGLDQGLVEPDLRLLERLPPECGTSVWVLSRQDVRKTARVRAALDFLAEAFPRALAR